MFYYYDNRLAEASKDSRVTEDHFKYGTGFFETILYDGEAVCNLEKHIERISDSTRTFGYELEVFNYEETIERLIKENYLHGRSAKINIYHLCVSEDRYKVMVTASAYTPPEKEKVFKLCCYPNVHESWLNTHKSMNYQHFISAKRYAVSNGCDDSIVTDSKGNILETSTAAVVLFDGSTYFAPKADFRLKSISLSLFNDTFDVFFKEISIDSIGSYEIFIMNSLMGVRKAVFQPV